MISHCLISDKKKLNITNVYMGKKNLSQLGIEPRNPRSTVRRLHRCTMNALEVWEKHWLGMCLCVKSRMDMELLL